MNLTEPEIRALLHDQHPDLADRPLREVPGGWDNKLWRLGDDLAVRLPRSDRAPDLLRKEHRWLPHLAPGLPLPVPVPLRLSEPSPRFPKYWTITTWVPGRPADEAPITAPASAVHLAEFLRALHQPAPPDAPDNPTRGVPLAGLPDKFDRRFGDTTGLGPDIRAAWASLRSAPAFTGPRVWLHADLHPANVVTAAGELTGIVDFGELCAGDPAADLSGAWLLLPADTIAEFLAAYGPVDAATLGRSRAWALLRAIALMEIGQAGERGLPGGKPTWLAPARAALINLVSGG